MNLPGVFLDFAADFSDETSEPSWSIADAVDVALSNLTDSEKLELRNFLTSLLARELPEDELHRIWLSARPNVAFEASAYRPLFSQIGDKLGK